MTTESSDNINRVIASDIFSTLSFYRPVLEHPILKDFLILSKAYESEMCIRDRSSAVSEKSAIFFCAPAPYCMIILELVSSICCEKFSTI